MGIGEKLKGLFKKKEKSGDGGKKKEVKVAKKASLDFSGDSLAKELTYAAEKINAQVEAGKITPARADQFKTQLMGIKGSGVPDDQRRIQISRVIGGVLNG